MSNDGIGILLTHIGSPSAPTTKAVRSYLKQFLSDPHVITLPRLLWQPILQGFVLPFRSPKSAALYQKIWTKDGSPLILLSEKIAIQLQKKLNIPVEIGMHYGTPSITDALEKLRTFAIKKIIVLPLFPQYSFTTTAATFDQVETALKHWTNPPEIDRIPYFADDESYISALCHSIQRYPIKHLLFSFHGIPKRFAHLGDPYFEQCCQTVQLVTEQLNLPQEQWTLSFQSRIGRAKWLSPYTHHILRKLPQQGITDLHIICPGFLVDCLETLEEIAIRGKIQFLAAGGRSFHYIPALNNSDAHIMMLQKLIKKYQGSLYDTTTDIKDPSCSHHSYR